MKRLWFAFFGLAAAFSGAPCSARADDTRYPIHLDHPIHPGDRDVIESLDALSRVRNVTWGDHQTKTYKEIAAVRLVSESEVLSVNSDGYTTAARYVVQACTLTSDTGETVLAPPGAVIVARASEHDVDYTIDGVPVNANVKRDLHRVIGIRPLTFHTSATAAFGTTPRAVGETWPCDKTAVLAGLAERSLTAPPESVDSSATLAGIEQIDGIRCLKLKTHTEADQIKRASPASEVSEAKISATYDSTIYVPLDPAIAIPREDYTMTSHKEYDLTIKKNVYHTIETVNAESNVRLIKSLPPATHPSTAPAAK